MKLHKSLCSFSEVIRKYFLPASICPTSIFYFVAWKENEKREKWAKNSDQEKVVEVMVESKGVGVGAVNVMDTAVSWLAFAILSLLWKK